MKKENISVEITKVFVSKVLHHHANSKEHAKIHEQIFSFIKDWLNTYINFI